MPEELPEYFYGPVFVMNKTRFVWFSHDLISPSPKEAKLIGLKMEAGYQEAKLPIKSVLSVAKFKSDGRYVMAMIGPEADQRPVIVLNPEDGDEEDFEGGSAQKSEAVDQMDPIEEIPYDQISDEDDFVRTAKW